MVDPPRRPEPGDTRPPSLAQPPGDRYRSRVPVEQPLATQTLARAAALGVVAVLGVAIVSALLRSILDINVGLLVLAGAGGWLVGAAVRVGAWSGRRHRASSAPVLLAASFGLLTWVGGLVGAWLVSMAILPASSRTLPERLVDTPFLDWMSPQFSLLEAVELLLLVGVAWFAVRSRAEAPNIDTLRPR